MNPNTTSFYTLRKSKGATVSFTQKEKADIPKITIDISA